LDPSAPDTRIVAVPAAGMFTVPRICDDDTKTVGTFVPFTWTSWTPLTKPVPLAEITDSTAWTTVVGATLVSSAPPGEGSGVPSGLPLMKSRNALASATRMGRFFAGARLSVMP